MITRIKTILNTLNISDFLMNLMKIHSEESFFIKQELDIRRICETEEIVLTLYKDIHVHSDENQTSDTKRGFASCTLNSSMSDEQITEMISDTYFSAGFAKNEYFPLTEKTECNLATSNKPLSINELEDALLHVPADSQTFINSSEFFITNTTYRIVNSCDVDVSFSTTKYSGEFVVQSILRDNVEIYQDFHFTDRDTDVPSCIKSLASQTLQTAKSRSLAARYDSHIAPVSPETILLEGSCLSDFFHFYLKRCDASMIYPKYSDYKIGDCIGAPLSPVTIRLKSPVPYSSEGIALSNHVLIDNNVIQTITGDNRMSHYIGQTATGSSEIFDIEINPGKDSYVDFTKQGASLRIVNFSDFQMDELSGQFGGEFRLAYYKQSPDSEEIPVTNGSVSANILDIIDTLSLSKETMSLNGYSGPKVIAYRQT